VAYTGDDVDRMLMELRDTLGKAYAQMDELQTAVATLPLPEDTRERFEQTCRNWIAGLEWDPEATDLAAAQEQFERFSRKLRWPVTTQGLTVLLKEWEHEKVLRLEPSAPDFDEPEP
jgi:hypothetical protein